MGIKIVIEHLEDRFGPWIIYEYINASKLVEGRIIYSNISSKRVARILARYGEVYTDRIGRYVKDADMIILDPSAKEDLSYYDTLKRKYIIIGGILGSYPPQGRTKKLLTDVYKQAIARRVGDKQMSIDGAVYTAYKISQGHEMKDIKFIDDLELDLLGSKVILPYRYPTIDNTPILSPIIRKIIEYEGVFSEYWLRDFG